MGGRHSDFMNVRSGARLIVRGSEFRINGTPVQGLGQPGTSIDVALGPTVVLSGIYADGTPFAIGGSQEQIQSSVQVIETPVPAAGPSVIVVPTDPVPTGVRSGQMLVLKEGGELPANFSSAPGSTVRIEGGIVGQNYEAVGSTIDMTGGQAGVIDAFFGTVANITGNARWDELNVYAGSVATFDSTADHAGGFRAFPGSTVNVKNIQLNSVFQAERAIINISGGSIGDHQLDSLVTSTSALTVTGGFLEGVLVTDHSTAQVSGGRVGYLQASTGVQARIDGGQVDWLGVHADAVADVHAGIVGDTDNLGGTTRIHGGALGDSHEWNNGTVELHGYDFQVDGVPVAGLDMVGSSAQLNYTPGSTITGTFSDGTPFNLVPNDNFQSLFITDGVLRLVRTAAPAVSGMIRVPTDPAPLGASAGQTVVVDAGGALGDHFLAGRDSNVEIRGGNVGDNFEAERSDVLITEGTIGNRMDIFRGAEVTMTGGTIGEEWEVHPGGVFEVKGGQIGRLGKALGGTVNITGGLLESGFTALQDSVMNISGGKVQGATAEGGTINVSGGEVSANLNAHSDSHVNVSGGRVRELRAVDGSNVAISGGNFDTLNVVSGARAVIRGGNFGDDSFFAGPTVDFVGLDFEVDGVPIAGLETPGSEVTFSILTTNQLFTGTLSDGTPFAFRSNEEDGVNSVKLVRAGTMPAGPAVIEVPSDAAPGGVRAGQQLTLREGGRLRANFNAGRGSVVNIRGGTVEENFEAFAAAVNIEGGQVGNDFDAFTESEINIRGGNVGSNFDAYDGSEVNMSGGTLARLDALTGSQINMGGGKITQLQGENGSRTRWSGGVIGTISVSGATSTLAIHGVDFKLNGVPLAGLGSEGNSRQFNIPMTSILTATLADGTPVVLGNGFNFPGGNAQIANGTLTLVRSAEPPQGPAFQQVTGDNGPLAVGKGQTLLVTGQGRLPSEFVAGEGSTVEVRGGTVGANFRAFDADLVIGGGSIGSNFVALSGTDLVITGGSFQHINLLSGTHTQIHGGLLPSFRIDAGAVVDIFGKSFLLNNQPISGFRGPGSSVVISQRGGQILSATLPDGSQLRWTLTAGGGRGIPFGISSDAVLRLRLVPEPTAIVIATLAATWIMCQRRRLYF
jgi:hypothetical protein